MAVDLAVIGFWWDDKTTVIAGVIVSGAFIGVNNTLVTTAVMSIAPVERPVASATYGFVRFIGGGLAPFFASKLASYRGEEITDATLPFIIGAGTLIAAGLVLTTVHRALTAADRGEVVQPELDELDRIEREDDLQIGAVLGNES
jgi:MFS family permease